MAGVVRIFCTLFPFLCGVQYACETGLDGTCYTIHTDKLTFNEAELRCKEDAGSLASIPDERHQAYMEKILADKPGTFYIGLKRVFPSNKFGWTDGSDAHYRNWDSPQVVKEKIFTHAAIYNEGNKIRAFNWIGTYGYRKHSFICQKKE